MTKEELHRLIGESIYSLVEKKLCPKGRAYYDRRIAAGEKPSAYLSGRSVKVCKGLMEEDDLDLHESLRDWFKKEDWVRIDTAGNITGACGTMKKGKATTRCLPRAKANSLTKAERAATSRKKVAGSKKGKQFVANTDKAKVHFKEAINPLGWEPIIRAEDEEIERTADELGLPYDTVFNSLVNGDEVTLTDEMWSRLENTDSYDINSEEEAIELAQHYGKDYQSIMSAEKTPPALILQYSPNKYYLIGGNTRLMFARAKGINPQVIMGTIEPLNKFAYQDVNDIGADLKESMLKDKETLKIMRGLGDKNDIKHWIKNYHSNPKNHKLSTYYRIERGSGAGYGGVGNGLYLGRDKQALSNFYDIDQEGLPVSEYEGNPKWLDLTSYSDFRNFEDSLLKQNIKIINSSEVKDIVLGLGYDGIKYYDPQATGEEFVLFNLNAVSKSLSSDTGDDLTEIDEYDVVSEEDYSGFIMFMKEAMDNPLPKDEEGRISIKGSIDVFKSLLSYCEALGDTPIMYRAVGGKLKTLVVRVTNADMSKIKGNTLTQVTALKELGIKSPTFASFDPSGLFFFGSAYTIIPKPPYKIYQSPEIFDLGVYSNPDIYKTNGNNRSQIGTYTDEEQIQRGKDAAKTYQQITSPLSGKERSEIIIDISEYYLISIGDMINNAGKFSGFKVDDWNKVKTYSQLSSIIRALVKYWTFAFNRGPRKVNENEEIDEYDVESKEDYEGFIMFMKEYSCQLNESKLTEAEYHGRKVQLGKIMQGDIKKFKVYVNNDKGKTVKVNFGFGGKSAKGKRMVIKAKNPKRRAAYRARHNCSNPGPRWKANYWSCKKW